jgi:hypothetical protein
MAECGRDRGLTLARTYHLVAMLNNVTKPRKVLGPPS